MDKLKFALWFSQRYHDWEWSTPGRGGITGFARYLGIPQPTVSRWLSGDYLPALDGVEQIAKIYPAIYEVLELPYPPQKLSDDDRRILDAILALPVEKREELLALAEEYLTKHGWQREP